MWGRVIALFGLSALIFAICWKMQSSLAGEKPAVTFEQKMMSFDESSIEPKDSGALLKLAELAFSRRLFDRALDYYKRYLELNPSDADTRARYASTLTFLNRAEEAVLELEALLKNDPQSFTLNAYLAIAYAQLNNKEMALKLGERALSNAPNAEARSRFSAFLETLK